MIVPFDVRFTPKSKSSSASSIRTEFLQSLETPRLLLRPFRESDLDAYAAICGDLDVMRYIGGGRTLDRSDTWRAIACNLGHCSLRGYGLWAWEEKATGQLVGRGGLWNPEGWPGVEVGWLLARSHWGKGFATEAATAAIGWAFTNLAVGEVISLIHPENPRSVRVAERLGEQLLRQAVVDGTRAQVWGIRRAQWESAQQKAVVA